MVMGKRERVIVVKYSSMRKKRLGGKYPPQPSSFSLERLRWVAAIPLLLLVVAGGVGFAEERLVAPGAEVEKLANGFRFTEGPAVDREGNLFFSDVPNNKIHQWSLQGELSTFREETGGANGLYFDAKGNLIACEGGNRRVTSTDPDGNVTVLVDEYGGKKLNSPNDLWIDPKGGVYFSDPRYGKQTDLQQEGFYVYYVSPSGKISAVATDLVKPNGVIGTSDGKRLYVADHRGRKTFAFDIQGNGSLTNKRPFAEQGSDGMTLDEHGNLYLTSAAVTVYAPDGEQIARIDIPERPANVCFGGADRRTLFVTARTSLYAVRMTVRGQ